MKKVLFVLLACFFLVCTVEAQIKSPVLWKTEVRKIDPITFEVKLIGKIDPNWHIYTLSHKSEIGVATSVRFQNNPLLTLQGKLKPISKPVLTKDPMTGEMVKLYERQAVFSQIVKLKAPVKTNLLATVEFMACDDQQCLPPTEKTITISLQ